MTSANSGLKAGPEASMRSLYEPSGDDIRPCRHATPPLDVRRHASLTIRSRTGAFLTCDHGTAIALVEERTLKGEAESSEVPGRARTRGWLRHRRTTSGAADPRTVDGSDPTPTEGRRPRPGRCPSWTTARCHPRAHRSSIGRPQAGTSCLKKWPLDLRPGQPSTRWRVLISSNLPRRGDDSLSEVRHRARTTRKPRKPDLCGERRSILFAATRHRRGSAVRSSIHWCGRLELTIHRAGVQSWLARLRTRRDA